MASVNKVILVGFLGKDPEITYLPSGVAITKFSIATSEKYKDKETTQWHNITTWDKLAEICAEHVRKGKQVYIEGRIEYRTWEKDGIKHNATEIVADKMQMLGGKE